MKISVIPFDKTYLNNNFFDAAKLNVRDNVLEPYSTLKSHLKYNGCEVNTADIAPIKDSDYILFFDLNLKYILQAYLAGKLSKSIYISFEPPVVTSLHKPENLKWISEIFGKVLTWQDDLIDNNKFFKLYTPMPPENTKHETINFRDKELITTIIGCKKSNQINELYSKRIEAIMYFEKKYENFHFFGEGWDKDSFKSFRGRVDNKYNTLKNYKFTICYENESNINGLISEKIFDCFYARTIPIFWGASNVSKYFPKETYIDKRDFDCYKKLDEYISNMSEEEYGNRIILIEKYLKSDNFKYFSSYKFSSNIYINLKNDNLKNDNLKNIVKLFLFKLLIRAKNVIY